MSAPLRVAVIGVGTMGQSHAAAFQRLADAQLVAVMDVDGERARQAGERYDVPAFTCLDDLLALDGLDAVCICTPDWLHRQPTLAAIARGLHVLVEKPLATTLDDADAMIAASEAASVTLMVGHILRFDPRYAQAQAAVASGAIGSLTHLYARRHNRISSGLRFQGQTTVVNFLGVHDIDILLWCADSPVVEAYAAGGRGALAGLGIEDGVFAVLRFASGAVGCLDVHWAMPPIAMPLDASIKVLGTKGQINVDGSLRAVTVDTTSEASYLDTVYGPDPQWTTGALLAQDAHFVESVRTNRRPLTDGPTARRAVAVAVAIARSLATGAPVQMK